jgi:hypothetical protein
MADTGDLTLTELIAHHRGRDGTGIPDPQDSVFHHAAVDLLERVLKMALAKAEAPDPPPAIRCRLDEIKPPPLQGAQPIVVEAGIGYFDLVFVPGPNEAIIIEGQAFNVVGRNSAIMDTGEQIVGLACVRIGGAVFKAPAAALDALRR